ncbi:long-chain fatty acid transport protein 4 isoform X1 [Culex quinquefasciatus]|nr:long-chain fatty acid transport protein 4 isoform X1 [Culex quinquefasciatus]XP_039439643.2 long-chain fatty acid transport protein 4 isoform X1 [Culex pipiens pallens]
MNSNEIKPAIVDIEKGQVENEPPSNGKQLSALPAPEAAFTSNAVHQSSARPSNERFRLVLLYVVQFAGLGACIAGVVLVWYFMGWEFGVPAVLIALLAVLIASGKWRWFYIAAVTAPRDVKALSRYVKLLFLVKKYARQNATIADIFAEYVAKQPEKVCFVFEGREWTFREVSDYSNRVANVFHTHGYKHGDVVGLVMENRPEFVGTWLGLSKLGVIIPLINHNLRKNALLHSITVAKCNALVYSEALCEAIGEITESLPSTMALYQFNDAIQQTVLANSKDLATLLQSASKELPTTNVKKASHHDQLLYIYTSGTTGLPKAAVITHSRYLFITAAIHIVAGFSPNDVFYTPLPLYHTAGGMMSIGQALIFGATVAIRKKFSASQYFTDCQKYNCTVGQYIGEMCRYILATPESGNDKDHKVRLIFGNGLRPQIWPQFVERFNIPRVAEFYGATEGNANIVNIDNTVGAIGFVSRIIPSVYPISIIRADPATGEPIRGKDGLCQLCQPNEPGVFIGKILPNNPSRAFLGYVDKGASEKKIVRDIFKKGDSGFLSGDLLVADERGNLYFKDRTGDTFRWKGENVSTSEVEAEVSNASGYRDTVVYGVEIPNLEGRAGMAAILDPEGQVDLVKLADTLKQSLPSYARPMFVRLLTKVDMTGTFKLKKLDLQKEGFDPNVIEDAVFYLSPKGAYERLTKEAYEQIKRGEIRF